MKLLTVERILIAALVRLLGDETIVIHRGTIWPVLQTVYSEDLRFGTASLKIVSSKPIDNSAYLIERGRLVARQEKENM